jgi:hypothetical protein
MHLRPTDELVALHECKLAATYEWEYLNVCINYQRCTVHRINITVTARTAYLAADKKYRKY